MTMNQLILCESNEFVLRANVKTEVLFQLMNAYRGSRGIAPLILDLGTIWR